MRLEQVREIFAGLLRNKDDRRPFADDEPLLTAGRLDSLDVLEMITLFEQKFGVDFSAVPFDQGAFESVKSTCAFLDEHGSAIVGG
jgi:acyl carrier protein